VTARLCLACRHPVSDAGCDHADHEVITLDTAGRERLLEAVWGDRDTRGGLRHARYRRAQRAAAAGTTSGVAAGVGITVLLGPSPPLVTAGGLFVAAVVGGLAGVVRGSDDDARFPRAAAPVATAATFATGTVVDAGDDERSPASALWCAAWAIELTLSRPGGPRAVFRDAWCAGLEIALDDGARARVAAGPWRPAGQLVPLLDVDEIAIHAHIRLTDPDHQPHEPLAPFHHDAVHEALLHVGDRVELRGAWEPIPDERAADALYRVAPPSVLVPVGWPTLRRVAT